MRDDRSGQAVEGRHVQRPLPGEGPDIGPRPYQAASVPRHTQHAKPPDSEGTGVWTPSWEGDDEPAQTAAHARRSPADPHRRGSPIPQGSARNPGEASTDLIPRPLLTHKEPGPPPAPRRPPPANPGLNAKDADLLRRRRIWRRVRYGLLGLGLLLFLGPIVAFLIGYFAWDVPNAAVLGASTNAQIVTLYYSDGQTELAKILPKTENRVNVKLDQVPKHVQDAVLAAEDRSYWSNRGFDPIGIGRAVVKQATGGAGGGSTITQQYVKVATQEDDFSLRRKFRELVWSIKISQQYSKETILENYLNIVYFGRQAYGIQAASQAYFGKDVGQLNPSEAALLAGMIQSPSRSDPTKNRPRAEGRWNFVLDGMVSQGWLDAAQRGTTEFPQVIPLDQVRAGAAVTDHRLHIQEQAMAELEAQHHDTATIQKDGGKIITTIDPKAQEAAVKAVDDHLKEQPANLKSALVAVDPKTGAVRAYYGGNEGTGINLADSQFSPGSSFKAFVMLAALDKGKSLSDVYSGNSPIEIGGNTFNNSESANYGSLTLKEAMTRSVNTTFVQLADEVGPQTVADAAHRAGIPETIDGKRTLVNADGSSPGLAIALGALPVRALDMAAAYATFADKGGRHEPFLVAEYRNAANQVIYKHDASPPTNALDPQDSERNAQLACNVTESLLDVPVYSHFELNGKRPAAAKTGTDQRGKTNENDNSWTVGYTPSISAAVWVGDPAQTALKTKDGKNVFGATFAGKIWKQFMDAYLGSIKASDDKFPDCEPMGKVETTTTVPEPTTPSPTKPGRPKPPDPTITSTDTTRQRPPRNTTDPTCLPLCQTTDPNATSQPSTGR